MKRSYILLQLVLLSVCCQAQQVPESADAILNAATKQAAKEGKAVFVIFHASWCGWCHKMDTALSDPAVTNFFTDHYIIRHVTVLESGKNKALETPGGAALYDKYNGTNQGLPFWVILDAGGKVQADALMRAQGAPLSAAGENSGCPARENEVAHFVNVLRQTSTLNELQLDAIRKRFRMNDPEYKP